jgi:starvation-inducible outer membrane lipoprotein
MKLSIIACSLLLTACATPPAWLANMYDRNDPCQQVELIKTGQYPSYCGASSGTKYVTRAYSTGNYLTVTKAQK